MGHPSPAASTALIYTTYITFLVLGLAVAYRLRRQSKRAWLSANGTQKGIGLALNFVASALGSGIFFTYPQIAALAGLQGLLIYSLSSGLPLLVFAALGPVIRRKCPDGFVLTEWTRQRYGAVTALYLSILTLLTMWLYMVAELSALQQVVSLLTSLDGLPAVVVQCIVTTIYTSLGGFRVSFVTDNIQGAMIMILIGIGVVAVGTHTTIDTSLIPVSNYLQPSLLGWQLMYILPVSILTNDFFMSGFWLRTFAAKSDHDLWVGVSIAAAAVTIVLTLVGASGLVAGWSGALGNPPVSTGTEFFQLLELQPAWIVGVVLVLVVSLSTSAFDGLQTAIVSSASNDLFRNRLDTWVIRLSVVVLIVPTVFTTLKSPSVLRMYLISNLISASSIPVLVLGLHSSFYFWRGFEVIAGGLGGLFSVFLFGLVYYHGDTSRAASLLVLRDGLYADDWSAFGAFIAAPVGGLLFAAVAFVMRVGFLWTLAWSYGHRFDAFDLPEASYVPVSGTYDDGSDGEFERLCDHDGDSGYGTSEHRGRSGAATPT